ncbi:ATP-binding protein [Streptomyces parvulus]
MTKCFRREAGSVPDARRFARAVLAEWNLPQLIDAAEMVTSELASNAVLHARHTAFRVTFHRLGQDQVQVAVIDRSSALPVRAHPDDEDDRGRGLAIVDALSRQWDVEPMWWGTKLGKRVWAVLAPPEPVVPPEPDVPMFVSHRAQVIYVLIVIAVAAFLAAAVGAQS